MSPEAKQAKSEYMKNYRIQNKTKINETRRNWAKNNPDKIQEYQERHWARKFSQL